MASVINSTTTNGVTVTGDNSGSLQLATNNGTTAVTVDTSQNVGIGVVPSAWGSGPQAIQNSSGAIWQFGSSNIYVGQNYYFNGTNRIYTTTAEATEYQQGAGIHRWYTAPSGTAGTSVSLTERMRIDSSGNLAVGTTSLANASARAAIVNSGGGSIVMQIQRSGENASYIGSDNSDIFSVWDSAPVKRFAVTSGGSCQNTTGSYGTISDIKLKENIVDATPKLEKVMQLQVKNYNLKSNPEFKQIGFISRLECLDIL